MNIREALKNCHLFNGLTDDELALVAGIGKTKDSLRGELLFSEGEEATGFYVVLAGRVKVYKLSPEGKERILHMIQPGQTFADAAIFGKGFYPAYAQPTEKSLLLFIPKKAFLDLLKSHAQMSINMIAGLSRFLRQFTTQIEELTFKDVPARLARALLEMDQRQTGQIELAMSKSQLASNLGTVSETLSRTLRKFQDDGLIHVDGKSIAILDADRLEDVAFSYRDE